MKKSLLLLSLMLISTTFCAQNVSFNFKNNTIVSYSGKALPLANVKQIEKNISLLLTALNKSCLLNQAPQLKNIQMNVQAREDILSLVSTCGSIKCTQTKYEKRALCDNYGFQVRGISVEILDNNYNDDKHRDLYLCFNKDGVITEVNFSFPTLTVNRIMEDAINLKDSVRRLTILSFVENFRLCYEKRDIETLKKIFSDDALIITGRVIAQRPKKSKTELSAQSGIKERIIYNTYKKEQYIARMERKFKSVKYLNLDFDDIEVEQSGIPGKTNFYGVTLVQHWQDSSYEDEGHLFLLWEYDETGEKDPVIHVRTWQPLYDSNGNVLSTRDRVNIHDYNF